MCSVQKLGGGNGWERTTGDATVLLHTCRIRPDIPETDIRIVRSMLKVRGCGWDMLLVHMQSNRGVLNWSVLVVVMFSVQCWPVKDRRVGFQMEYYFLKFDVWIQVMKSLPKLAAKAWVAERKCFLYIFFNNNVVMKFI